MNQWEKNPYVRKHVHRWKLVKIEAPNKWNYDGKTPWYAVKEIDAARDSHRLTRECEDCTAKQRATVINADVLVKGYEAIADLLWTEVSRAK